MNYIGVRGHRGAGKSSIAWLLGNTIELIQSGNEELLYTDMFKDIYKSWCDKLMSDPNTINGASFKYVYLDSFSDSIKTFIQLLLGCPSEYLYEDIYKDTIIINFRDFSYKHIDDFEDIVLVKADELYKLIDKEQDPQPMLKNLYMTLREFILYFGLEVMQRYFGRNVWVKSLRANSELLDDFYGGKNSYKIFTDLKTPAEATYIKQKDGLIVNVVRPDNKKGKSGLERLGRDDRIDYSIEVNGDLYSTIDKIKEISLNITNYGRRGTEKETSEQNQTEQTEEPGEIIG